MKRALLMVTLLACGGEAQEPAESVEPAADAGTVELEPEQGEPDAGTVREMRLTVESARVYRAERKAGQHYYVVEIKISNSATVGGRFRISLPGRVVNREPEVLGVLGPYEIDPVSAGNMIYLDIHEELGPPAPDVAWLRGVIEVPQGSGSPWRAVSEPFELYKK